MPAVVQFMRVQIMSCFTVLWQLASIQCTKWPALCLLRCGLLHLMHCTGML